VRTRHALSETRRPAGRLAALSLALLVAALGCQEDAESPSAPASLSLAGASSAPAGDGTGTQRSTPTAVAAPM
jgi:hypothetical protein